MYKKLYKELKNIAFLSVAIWMLFGYTLSYAGDETSEIFQDTIVKSPETEKITMLYRTIDKAKFLGAASTVFTDRLSTTLSSNIITALPGRMAGLYVSQNTGINYPYVYAFDHQDALVGVRSDNNGMFNLASRGTDPIIFVDGVLRDFTSIDPENIESITIQKDALSGIMLGGRSSRSVMLITTKEPVKKGLQLSFTGKYGFQQPIKMPKPLPAYQYAYLLNEAFMNEEKMPAYTYEDFNAWRMGTDPVGHPDVNWYDQTMKSRSPIQSYNLNVTGGNDDVQYFVNLGYFNEEGLFRTSSANSYNTNYTSDRYLITSKVNVKVTNDLKVGASIIGRITDETLPGYGIAEILQDLYIFTANNSYPVYNPDGSYGGNQSYQTNLMAGTDGSGYWSSNSRDGMANISIDYDLRSLLKGLSFSAQGNVVTQSKSAIDRHKQASVFLYKSDDGNGKGVYETYGASVPQQNNYVPVSNAQQMYGQLALNYKLNFAKHEVGATLLGDFQDLLVNYLLPKQFGNVNGRLDYNYDKKYFAEAAISESYYNRFAPGKQWGTFYAFGLGWDISRENFLSKQDCLDQFKLRGVFGNTGNVGGSESDNYYTWREGFVGGNNYQYGGYTFGSNGGLVESVYEYNKSLVNKNMTYEQAYKLNIGADISLLHSIEFNADFYRDNYFDMLYLRGKSDAKAGLYYPLENIAKFRREGVELALTYRDRIADVNYFITGNWNLDKSKIVFIDEQELPSPELYATGRPMSIYFGLICEGYFQSQEEIDNSPVIEGEIIRPGDLKYRDVNGDDVINEYDRRPISGEKPFKYFGLNFGCEYRGFEFSMMFQGAYDRDIYLMDAGTSFISGFPQVGQTYGQAYEHLLGRWTPETAETATFPRLRPNGNEYNAYPLNGFTSFWVRSGNYIRLKNINLGYAIPEAFCRNHFGGVRVKIFANAQNIWTKAACDLVDPEVMNFILYPVLKGFNFGVNVKF